jgi:hypothetical protein
MPRCYAALFALAPCPYVIEYVDVGCLATGDMMGNVMELIDRGKNP